MLLEVENLQTEFKVKRGTVKAVNNVSFGVEKGEILAIVGESGSGKSVTSLSVMGLIREPGKVTGGKIIFDGENLVGKSNKEMNKIRGDKISMIFQEPMTSLNPVYKIGDQIMESILTHTDLSKEEAKKTAIKIITRTITANIMATIFQIRRERRFLIARCSFILDSCSATSLATFSFSIFEPSNSLTDTSSISARRISVSASGTDRFFSHLEIVCLTT